MLGCFLTSLLSRCCLSLSWVLPGTPSNSLGVFGTSLGSLLGLSRGSWGLSWVFLALLGLSRAALLAYLGLFWTLLGCSWASLFDPLGPRGGKAATVPQDSPKSHPRDTKGSQNGPPKSVFFVSFLGSVFEPSSGLLFGKVFGRLALKNLRFHLGGPSKTLLPPGHLQE